MEDALEDALAILQSPLLRVGKKVGDDGEEENEDMEGEETGLLRDADTWTDIDLANISFGQGMSATPLQVLNAFNAIANGGVLYKPRIVSKITENNKVTGVKCGMGMTFQSKTVVLTAGTFLNGIIHIGRKQFGGGRMAEKSSTGITAQLESLGLVSGRMKTGTPPRVDGRSLDYSKMEEQAGDENPSKFSYTNQTQSLEHQRSCPCCRTHNNWCLI
jgi:cell division protein FtsI/penicillin-binding protein 2